MKPMNCPFHIQIYKAELRSYRDLPYRLAEFGTVYRYEQSGELGGLTRVRGFTVDDSHLFVTPEQLDEEFLQVVDLILTVFRDLELRQFKARLSFRGPDENTKIIGSPEAWDRAEAAIRRAVEQPGHGKHRGTGGGRLLRPQAGLSLLRCPGAAVAGWGPCRWTTTCRSGLTWNTWRRMAPANGQ